MNRRELASIRFPTMRDDTQPRGERRYFAFISYSHSDRQWANWLHRRLEAYRLPRGLRTPSLAVELKDRRIAPVFMDREELSTSADLATSIRIALQGADNLVVICSPAAARSRWVDEEIRSFAALGRGQRIFCLIVAGEPGGGVTQDAALECFPPALRESEPLAADVREGADGRRAALLKLVAGLIGVPLDELRRRDQQRRQRRLAWISSAALTGCVVLAGLSVAAWLARNEAERQRQLAERKTLTAQRTTEFLKSLFQVSDPGEARGNSVTAREILDRGVEQIGQTLGEEPTVKAELLLTMGEVYNGLGLYTTSVSLLKDSREIAGQDVGGWIRGTLALAETELQQEDLAGAGAHLAEAERRFEVAGLTDAPLQARILRGRASQLGLEGNYAEARTYLARALDIAVRHDLAQDRVEALENQAMLEYNEGTAGAEDSFRRAHAARVALSGETHPKALESLNGLAALAYQRRDYRSAELAWTRMLEAEIRLLGAHHPELAATRNNLGRLWLESRQYAKARELLARAVADYEAQHMATDTTMMFVYSNLALARLGLDENAAALPLLGKALQAAEMRSQPLRGPIRVYQAEAQCRLGRFGPGLASLDRARVSIAADYAQEAWRMALLENVRAECIAGTGRAAQAARLLDANLPVLLARWSADTAFGEQAVARAIRVYGAAGEVETQARYQAMQR